MSSNEGIGGLWDKAKEMAGGVTDRVKDFVDGDNSDDDTNGTAT